MKKHFAGIMVALCLASIAIVGLQFLPPFYVDKNIAPASLRIEKGTTASKVASILRNEKLIRSEFAFRLLLKVAKADTRLEAGTYMIKPGTGPAAIVRMLASGDTVKIPVTIPEGSTTRMIAGYLEKAGVCSAGEFLAAAKDSPALARLGVPSDTAEGFLFPDTYVFSGRTEAASIVEVMTRNFFQKLEAIAPGAVKTSAVLREAVTLASIVEREYRVAEEAGLIASVFKNRMAIGMGLQSCATIAYIITERQGKPHPSVIKYEDLAINDPYNTYRWRGLPPGPIANPGRTALDAVFNGPKTDYLYFRLADEKAGRHRFSKTFDEHTGETLSVKSF
jgi:UPF0755 protein